MCHQGIEGHSFWSEGTCDSTVFNPFIFLAAEATFFFFKKNFIEVGIKQEK